MPVKDGKGGSWVPVMVTTEVRDGSHAAAPQGGEEVLGNGVSEVLLQEHPLAKLPAGPVAPSSAGEALPGFSGQRVRVTGLL